MDDWTYIPRPWIDSRTFPADLDQASLYGLVRNCYLTFPNILAAAKVRDMQLIRIGTQRKSRSRKAARATRPDAEGRATPGVANEAEVEADGGQGDGSADEADGSTVKGGSAVEGGGSDSNGTAGGIASSTAISQPLPADGLQPAAADRAGAGLTLGAV